METEHVRATDRIFVIVGLVQSLCVCVFVHEALLLVSGLLVSVCGLLG